MIEDNSITPQRVVNLVMLLLREIREKRLVLDEVENFSEDLIVQGYTLSEINAAFSWVFSRMEGEDPADVMYSGDSSSQSFRVLHPAERSVLRADAQGQLLEMTALNLLNNEDLERIIERAMSFGGPLGAEEIRLIVHSYLFEDGNHHGLSGLLQISQASGTIN